MKKFNVIVATLFATLLLTCMGVRADSFDDSESLFDVTLSSDISSTQGTRRHKLPASDFDFEANTILVDVAGDKFPVVDVGEGPVVLLVHGWPDSKELWRYQIPFLVDAGYRVLAPDLRGFGDAPKTEDAMAYRLDLWMGDLINILDNMGIDNVNLVAHDWGAAIGWTMARFRPQYVNSFVAISIGAPGNPGLDLVEQRSKNWYLPLFAQPGLGAYELSKDDWSLFRNIASHPDEENIINKLSEPGALEFTMKPYQANYQSLLAGCTGDFVPVDTPDIEYPLVRAPTLGILGGADFAMLEPQMTNSVDYVVKGNFKYKHFRGLGHWMMLERPRKINRTITRFLDCHAMYYCR